MIHWLAAAGLLAAGMYHNAKGYSGAAQIDFGRVIPGHSYYYKFYFRNDAGVPLKLTGEAGCGSCPQLSARGGRLAPGDSIELSLALFVKTGLRDSVSHEVRMHTDDGSKRGLWIYRVRYLAAGKQLFRARNGPVDVRPDKEGYLMGEVVLTSRAKAPLLVRPVGMPHGIRYHPEVPARLPAGGRLTLRFRSPPEYFTKHRSITLEAVPEAGGSLQRLSLPFSP